MPRRRILILGGTGDARALAGKVLEDGHDVVTSLAGVTREPERPAGAIRRGGFGGAEGLAAYLTQEKFEALVDATHPFATQISINAKAASEATGILLYRLERPPWLAQHDDNWIDAANMAEAVAALPFRARALVTVGRKEAAAFFSRHDISGVVRMIETPRMELPRHWQLVLGRPPFTVTQELQLMTRFEISHLVTKNSGGEQTRAKLIAARQSNIPVVMIRRAEKPAVPTFGSAQDVLEALRQALSA